MPRSPSNRINRADALHDAMEMIRDAIAAGTHSAGGTRHICAGCGRKTEEIHYIDGRKVFCPECADGMGKGMKAFREQQTKLQQRYNGRAGEGPTSRPAGTDDRAQGRAAATEGGFLGQ